MNKRDAKRIACSFLAVEAQNHINVGAGRDIPEVETSEDMDRLQNAFAELAEELRKRAKDN